VLGLMAMETEIARDPCRQWLRADRRYRRGGMFWGRKDGFKDLRQTHRPAAFRHYEAGALMFAANPLLGVVPVFAGCLSLYVPQTRTAAVRTNWYP